MWQGPGSVRNTHSHVAHPQQGMPPSSTAGYLAQDHGRLIGRAPVVEAVVHWLVKPVRGGPGAVGGARIVVQLQRFLRKGERERDKISPL